jgi:predicted regulator of Ras-like GTPase activity (Roadblock/LC7/MglB family)
MATTKEMITQVLDDLKNVGDVEASAVVSRDGLLMAGNITAGIRAETFAAMSATMLGAAETAISELNKGVPNRVIVETASGKIVATGAGPKALLVMMVQANAGLGLILVEMDKAAGKIKEVLG